MRKIKDRIILGAVSGMLAAFIARVVNSQEYKLGLTEIRYNQLAAVLFIPKHKTHTMGGNILGGIINNVNVSITGVLVTYVLSLTGRDKAIVKGMGVGSLFWVLVNGLLSNVGLKVKSQKPLTPLLSFLDHVLAGALTSFFITKFGDDSLFPDKNIRNQEKIPLVYSGTPQKPSLDNLKE